MSKDLLKFWESKAQEDTSKSPNYIKSPRRSPFKKSLTLNSPDDRVHPTSPKFPVPSNVSKTSGEFRPVSLFNEMQRVKKEQSCQDHETGTFEPLLDKLENYEPNSPDAVLPTSVTRDPAKSCTSSVLSCTPSSVFLEENLPQEVRCEEPSKQAIKKVGLRTFWESKAQQELTSPKKLGSCLKKNILILSPSKEDACEDLLISPKPKVMKPSNEGFQEVLPLSLAGIDKLLKMSTNKKDTEEEVVHKKVKLTPPVLHNSSKAENEPFEMVTLQIVSTPPTPDVPSDDITLVQRKTKVDMSPPRKKSSQPSLQIIMPSPQKSPFKRLKDGHRVLKDLTPSPKGIGCNKPSKRTFGDITNISPITKDTATANKSPKCTTIPMRKSLQPSVLKTGSSSPQKTSPVHRTKTNHSEKKTLAEVGWR